MVSEVICLLVLDGCLRNREKEVLQEVVTCDLQELGASEGPVCGLSIAWGVGKVLWWEGAAWRGAERPPGIITEDAQEHGVWFQVNHHHKQMMAVGKTHRGSTVSLR